MKRIVPRNNESINETWIADRDRFSYEAIYSPDRLQQPMVKEGGEWREAGWEEALEKLADVLKSAGDDTGMLVNPSATLEEGYLAAKLAEALGAANIDHRLRRRDFSDQDADPVYPSLGMEIADIESQDAILVVGSNLRHEAPILAHRVRKAALAGSKVSFVNTADYDYLFDQHVAVTGGGLVEMLAGVLAATGASVPAGVKALVDGVKPSDDHKAIAESLKDADSGLLLLGNVAGRHGAFSAIRALAAAIADATGATLGSVSEGANSAGLSLAGVLPHRGRSGKTAAEIIAGSLDALVLLNVEPDADLAGRELGDHKYIAALTPFVSDALKETADLLLPIGTWAETSGTFVNVTGTWQSFKGFANPVGEARPAWKVLRVLGNLVDAEGFDYVTSEDVLAEAKHAIGDVSVTAYAGTATHAKPNGEDAPSAVVDTPIYSVDGLVRRAHALQQTVEAKRAREAAE